MGGANTQLHQNLNLVLGESVLREDHHCCHQMGLGGQCVKETQQNGGQSGEYCLTNTWNTT